MTDFTSIGLPADLPEIAPPDLAGQVDPPKEIIALSPKQKAAVVVRALLADGGHLTLSDLPTELQADLATTLGSLKKIDGETERRVIAEFVNELESGNRNVSGLQGALAILDGSISPEVAKELSKDTPVRPRGDPWPQLAKIPAEKIAAILETESPEIAAICLSKLNGTKSAEILGEMSGPQARLAAFTVSRVAKAKPSVVQTIGRTIVDQLSREKTSAFTENPAEILGSMLLSAPSRTRDEIMDGLIQEDQEFASLVRNEIFIFADIHSRIEATDIPKILRDIDQSALLDALAFSSAKGEQDAESAEFILSNMSKRLAEGLREEMSELNAVPEDIGEAAQGTVVAAIRELEGESVLTLKPREPKSTE